MTSSKRKTKAPRNLTRDETVEEFLARGGTIKKCPPGYCVGASLAHPFTDRRTGKRRGGHL